MGKIDTEAKAYLSNDERFSDLFNFWIYNGKNVIQPNELQELEDNHILQFVPDYKLNLLSPNLLTDKDFDKFHTNLGVAMQFLKHQHDDNMNWLQNRKQLVDRATAEFIRTATGTMFEIDKKEGVIDMCRAWDNSLKQAKAEAQNSERLNSIRNVMKSLDVTVNRAMEILCIPAEEQEKYISMIQPSH